MVTPTPIWDITLTADFNLARVTETLVKFTGNLGTDLAACCRALDLIPHPSFRLAAPGKLFGSTGIRFDDVSFKILCMSLSHCPTITGVKFNNSGLTDEQLDMLERLCTKDHMTFLQLDWNSGVDPDKYVRFVGPESKLQTLVLRRCEVNDASFRSLCHELAQNTTLLALDLYGSVLTTLEPFAELMRVNHTLKAISLASCGLTDDELGCLVPVIGRMSFPAEHVEAHRKAEKDRDAILAKNAKLKGKKQPDPVPNLDPIEQSAETGEWWMIKGGCLEIMNLSLNSFNSFSNLQALLVQANLNFKALVMGPGDLGHADRKRLKANYGDHLVA
jgi:hypothetical protein